MVIDVKFDTIDDPAGLETLNNIPGVLENGIFVGVTDLVWLAKFRIISPLCGNLKKRLATTK